MYNGQFAGGLIVIVVLFGSMWARASPNDAGTPSTGDFQVVSIEPSERGWDLSLVFAPDIAMPTDLTVEVTGGGEARTVPLSAASQRNRAVTVELPRVPNALIAVRIVWMKFGEGLGGSYLLFTQDRGTLRAISVVDASRQLDVLEPGTMGPEYPAELSALSPFDNPALPVADREYARHLLDTRVATVNAALAKGGEARVDGKELGCSGAQPNSTLAVMAIVAPFLLLMRRRRVSAIGFVVLATLAATDSRPVLARTVYGYVVFWDSRNIGSNVTGSRIPWCDTSAAAQNCVAGSADCCFRAMDGVTVTVGQDGSTLATQITNQSGFYALTFTGDDSQDYAFRVSFARPSGSGYAGALQEVQISPPTVLSVIFKKTLPQNTPNYWLPDLRLNSGGDSTSINGNRATIWASISETQRGIAAEGDTRHRHLYGMPQNGPDDVILIDPSGGTGSGSDCPTSFIGVDPTYARTLHPAMYMATIYRGRVVGCNSTAYTNGVVVQKGPAFPPTPRNSARLSSNPYTGEGIALGVGLDFAVSFLLARWRPADTTWQTIDSALPCSLYLNSNMNFNGNDCAYGVNNSRGLWEWIDTPTAGMSTIVDNSDLTFKDVMDGLVKLQSTGGTGDGQAGESSFTSTGVSCVTNENCNPGEACAIQAVPTSPIVYCASGDPNGSNIEDLATAINALATPGRGSLMTSAQSVWCVTGPDTTYEFNGGFVDN